jgi:hypothetical protein
VGSHRAKKATLSLIQRTHRLQRLESTATPDGEARGDIGRAFFRDTRRID